MAGRGNPATQFKPGNPGGGRKKTPEAVKKLQTASQEALVAMMKMSKEELAAKLADPKTDTTELMIGSIIAKAVKEGDQARLNFLWDRLFGKVKEVVEQTTIAKDYDPADYEEIPDNVLLKFAEKKTVNGG